MFVPAFPHLLRTGTSFANYVSSDDVGVFVKSEYEGA
jgi:hypothetical protein